MSKKAIMKQLSKEVRGVWFNGKRYKLTPAMIDEMWRQDRIREEVTTSAN